MSKYYDPSSMIIPKTLLIVTECATYNPNDCSETTTTLPAITPTTTVTTTRGEQTANEVLSNTNQIFKQW